MRTARMHGTWHDEWKEFDLRTPRWRTGIALAAAAMAAVLAVATMGGHKSAEAQQLTDDETGTAESTISATAVDESGARHHRKSNLEIAQQFVDAYNSGDRARLADLLTEDAQILIPAMGISHGKHSQQGQNAMDLVTDRTIEVRRMIASGNAVAIEFLWHAISGGGPGLAPAGERLEMEDCVVLDIRDGLISRYVEYIGRFKGIDLDIVSGRVVGSPQGG